MRSTDSARSTAEPRSASRTRGGGGTGGGAAARKKERRHQIPGLRNTPYLKVYILRCDDNDSYKNTQRKLLREWVTTHATDVGGDNHDAFEWLILHVVLPGTPAALQPRSSSTSGSASGAGRGWMKGGSVSLLDKIKSDFNGSNAKVDRVAQIRIPAAHPALATLSPPVAAAGGSAPESVAEVEAAWADLVGKLKSLILTSFDARVGQYEEDVRERDSQRKHPGWNFCTFFVLKEGLARAFESVGLVEDALVLYDELGFGLEAIVREQEKGAVIGGGFVPWTNEGRHWLQQATNMLIGRKLGDPVGQEEEGEDGDGNLIDADRKPYRDLILSNDISIFDFRCYLFSRQATLLLRLGRRCWEPGALEPVSGEVEGDDLTRLAEVCMRTIEFVTSVSRVLRGDLALAAEVERRERLKKKVAAGQTEPTEPDGFSYEELEAIVDNLVSSWGYSVCAQLLAETGSAALPEGLEQGGGKWLLDAGRKEKTVSVPQMAHLEICPDDADLADLLAKHSQSTLMRPSGQISRWAICGTDTVFSFRPASSRPCTFVLSVSSCAISARASASTQFEFCEEAHSTRGQLPDLTRREWGMMLRMLTGDRHTPTDVEVDEDDGDRKSVV